MKTADEQVADGLAELRAIAANYKAGGEAWRQQRRAIIDIIVAHADVGTLEAVLAYLEKSSCDWTRWPAESQ